MVYSAAGTYNIQTPYNPVSENYTDPSLPNYRPAWWQRSVLHWRKTLDWTGFLDDIDFKNRYLRIVPGEFVEDRTARLLAEDPEPFFRDAVEDHASIFTQFELSENAPRSLIENKNNVDKQGTDLWQWSGDVFNALFRDGGVCVGADIDRNVEIGQRRPKFLWIPMRDVFWVEYRSFGDVDKWSRVSIRRAYNTLDENGHILLLNKYYSYELDEFQRCFLTVWDQDKNGNFNGPSTDPIPVFAANGEPLNRLPFSDKLSFLGDFNLNADRFIQSPFADILSLNIKHYNQSSELSTVRCKSAMPTPIRYWANGVPDTIPPFYAGTGKTQDYAAGSKVEYLELSGVSLPELREGLRKTEATIQERDNKLFHAGQGFRSATEAAIENQKAKVGMPRIKSIVESAYQDLFQIWQDLADRESRFVEGSIIVDDSALDAPPDASEIIPYLQAIDRGIPTEAVIAAMLRRGIFTKEDFEESAGMAAVSTLPIDPDEVIQ
jgi:hypothetical protein